MSYFNHSIFPVLLESLEQPQSSLLRSFIDSDDVLGLVSQSVDRSQPVNFNDVFFKELFRKVSDADLGIDTAQVAISGFLEVESRNVSTNERLKNLQLFIRENPATPLAVVIRRIRSQIFKILGSAPTYLEPNLTFGATADLKRNSSAFRRMVKPTVSAKALEYLRTHNIVRRDYTSCNFPIGENPHSPFGSIKDDFIVLDHIVLDTVPKTAKIDRVICKSQTVDISYQTSIGKEIKQRLLHFGLDINNLPEKHKLMAKLSSIDGMLSTIDLSAASDTISTELVRLLMPSDWFHLLDAFRATHIKIGEDIQKLEMFSPAGCGFTFELETLIFYACSLVTSKVAYLSAPPDISVFGDDIILPTQFVEPLRKMFSVFGFVINENKSFTNGSFRESCGGDFYLGKDVRGYNAKALPQTPRDWIAFANAIRRVCYYNNYNSWRNDGYFNLWIGLIQLIPKEYRLFGPKHYGDICVNTEDERLYTIRKHRWNGESIKLHTARGGSYTSADREISDSRISSNLVGRICCHESLKGHGRMYSFKDGEYFYPSSILTSTVGISYTNRWLPYTLYGQAPEDLDELAEFLNTAESSFFRDPHKVARKFSLKLLLARRDLIDSLKAVSLIKHLNFTKDVASFLEFDF